MTGQGKEELPKQDQNPKRHDPAAPPPRYASWRCRAAGRAVGAALTHDGVLGLEEGSPFAQPHGSAHLPRIVLWHVYDLEMLKNTHTIQTASDGRVLEEMSLGEALIPWPFLVRHWSQGKCPQ